MDEAEGLANYYEYNASSCTEEYTVPVPDENENIDFNDKFIDVKSRNDLTNNNDENDEKSQQNEEETVQLNVNENSSSSSSYNGNSSSSYIAAAIKEKPTDTPNVESLSLYGYETEELKVIGK